MKEDWPTTVVRCECGLTYLPSGWRHLPLIKRTHGETLVEIRMCQCGTQLSATLDGRK